MNFYPGPSKLNPQAKTIANKAFDSGILSKNHRSPEFELVFKVAQENLRSYLNIPLNYDIHFVSSATECWQIIGQSFIEKTSSHIYNGAFGEKWSGINSKLGLTTENFELDINKRIEPFISLKGDIICLTQCETSNGTMVSDEEIKKIKSNNPDKLIAIDATSSLGGIETDISLADIWFASVQKCFGIPAGLGVLITSPFALERANKINTKTFYNSFLNIQKNTVKHQTTHTPNILDIYLLSKTNFGSLNEVTDLALQKKSLLSDFIKDSDSFEFLTSNEHQALTVNCITTKTSLPRLFELAAEKNITLGKGYGKWKENTFRIANFPAHTITDYEQLISFLKSI